MQRNILRSSDVTSIYLIYSENYSRKRLSTRISFLDTKECYLASDIPNLFKKPKKNQEAEIVAYTEDGVYKANVKIKDCVMSGNEILYITQLPSTWNYLQLRQSSRKKVEADFCIDFNDGYKINSQIYDISLGGISFYASEPILDVYTKVSGVISFELPSNSYVDIASLPIKVETRFSRWHKNRNNINDQRYVYKFLNMPPELQSDLKKYLIRLL